MSNQGGSVFGSGLSLALAFAATAGASHVPAPASTSPDTACIVRDLPVEGRLSPLDSLTFRVGQGAVKICYSRPSSRGRVMIGGHDVPYGRLWRTGANEPTMVHTTGTVRIAGLEVTPGSYSLYTIPDSLEWVVILNRSITQWGHIASYTRRVRELEVGRAVVRRERPERRVETMTFRAERSDDGRGMLILEWEHSRLPIPITAASR